MARPIKFTPDMCQTVERYKQAKTTKRACAQALGITQQTWCNWVKRFPEFAKAEDDWYNPFRPREPLF